MVQRYHMPWERSGGNSLFWYSFDFASVHTVVLSSEHDCGEGSPQRAWLARDLAAVDRALTPWLLVELHRPLYNAEAYAGDYNTSLGLRACYEDLFLAFRVDVVLAGHYHSYLRTSKVRHGARVPASEPGMYHFTVGSAGSSLDAGGLYPDLPWVDHFEESYGYGRVTVHNGSALLWEFVRNADSADGAPVVADSAWIFH